MNCMQTMEQRRSIRQYQNKEVTREQLYTVLHAAQLAPSWKNGQPWQYIVLSDRALIQKLGEACRWNPSRSAYENATYFLALCMDPEKSGNREGKPYYMVDAGITLQQAMLAATELGLGTCWIGAFAEQPVKVLLGVPYNWRVVALSPLGVPDEIAEARPRRPIDGIAFENGWGNTLSR